ncbi:MAG: LuxR C-terminal-related transcriptional regulator [Brevinematales bacterium]|nr:LuxR C-terminal-related transcriptional regulator [Brevinematales bacterium]
MNYFILFYYIFSLLSGSIAIFLSFFAFLKYKNKVSVTHLFFQILLFLFVFTHTVYFYFFVINFNRFNYVFLLNVVYVILLGWLCYIVPILTFSLVGKEMKKIFERFLLFFPISGVLNVTIVFLLKLNEKFTEFLIYLYSLLLILIILFSLWLIITNISKMEKQIKNIMLKIVSVVILFLPGFLVDANFEILQNRLKVIPKVFNFIGLFYIVWNVFTIYYAFIFLSSITDNSSVINVLPKDFLVYYNITEREKKILEMLLSGYTNKEIAHKLCLSEGTIKNYIYVIFQKLNISNRMQIVRKVSEFMKKIF